MYFQNLKTKICLFWSKYVLTQLSLQLLLRQLEPAGLNYARLFLKAA